MDTVNTELKKIVDQLKSAQVKFQTLLNNQDWVDEARKYAERQGKEVKKLISADVSRVKTFLERERKELEKMQKQIPGEVKKLRQFAKTQKKEFERLLNRIGKTTQAKGSKKKSAPRKKTARKKSAAAAQAHG
ncbi:MAG: hypothetical protein A2X94_12800 [Bdellovibrionales bacterium GWB1_55_8]|nr:MAG: hypothetical protein A2X94_12800 [Bdellovibrionales bacterium GWB1_55_8]